MSDFSPTIDMWLDTEKPELNNGILTIRKFSIENLAEEFAKITSTTVWNHLYIFADNITIRSEQPLTIRMSRVSQSVTIVARSLNMLKGGLVFVAEEASALLRVDLYIQKFAGSPAPKCFVVGRQNFSTNLIPENLFDEDRLAYNKTVVFDEKMTNRVFVDPGSAGFKWQTINSVFYWLLIQTFQEAYAKSPSDANTALSMFHWVGYNARLKWAEDSGYQMVSLATQADAMATYLGRPSNLNYIPILNLLTQIDTIKIYLEEAREIESKYNQFLNIDAAFKTRQGTAELFIQNVEANATNVENLIKRTREKIQDEQNTYEINKSKFDQQRAGLDASKHEVPGAMAIARDALRDALDKKKEKEITDAAFAVFGAVSSLATMAVGNVAAGPEAVGRFAEIIEKINEIMELLEKINQVVETLATIMALVEAIQSETALPDANLQIPIAQDSVQLSKSDWGALREKWDAGFAPYIFDPILGQTMANYCAEGRILFIYGEAMTENRRSIADLQGELVQLTMQTQVYRAQKQKIREFINLQQDDEAFYKQVALLLKQQYFDTKRRLLLQTQDYNDAFRYWALQEPQAVSRITINSEVGSSSRILSSIRDELNQAMKKISSSRPTGVVCHISRDISNGAIDPSVGTIQQFEIWKSKQFDRQYAPIFHIPIQLSELTQPSGFEERERVRILGVDVLFEGLEKEESNFDSEGNGLEYLVKITNTGSYSDRLLIGGKMIYWHFTAQSHYCQDLSRCIHRLTGNEKLDNDSVLDLEMNEKVAWLTYEKAQESSPLGGFYTPTPFTTWTIEVVNANRLINWSKVTSIKLRLFGTAL